MHRTSSLRSSGLRFGGVVMPLALLAGLLSGCTTIRPVAQERIGMVTQNIAANAESPLRPIEAMVAATGPDMASREPTTASLH